MSTRGIYRKHSLQFKLQICTEIRSGLIRRREAQLKHNLSNSQLQRWLSQYDGGELTSEEVGTVRAIEYENKIAALERKVGQLTMELELLKKTPRLRLVTDNESSSIVSGPKAAPSGEDAK